MTTLDGVLNLGGRDGWSAEASGEDVTVRSGGSRLPAAYDRLEHTVLPLYRSHPAGWRHTMNQVVVNIAPFFEKQRPTRRCASEACLR